MPKNLYFGRFHYSRTATDILEAQLSICRIFLTQAKKNQVQTPLAGCRKCLKRYARYGKFRYFMLKSCLYDSPIYSVHSIAIDIRKIIILPISSSVSTKPVEYVFDISKIGPYFFIYKYKRDLITEDIFIHGEFTVKGRSRIFDNR